MVNSLYKYYNIYVRRELISKLNFKNINNVCEFESIELSVDLNNIESLESQELLDSIKLLEGLSGQKVKVQDFGSIKGVRGFSTGRKVKCNVTLRKDRMYNFLEYLIYIVIPLYIKRYGYLKLNNSGTNVFNFIISDMNVFYNLKGEVDFNKKLNITFRLKGKKYGFYLLLQQFFMIIN